MANRIAGISTSIWWGYRSPLLTKYEYNAICAVVQVRSDERLKKSAGALARKAIRDRKWEEVRQFAESLWAQSSNVMSGKRVVEELAARGFRYSRRTLYARMGNREEAQARARKKCA